jgi:hypothetical protein
VGRWLHPTLEHFEDTDARAVDLALDVEIEDGSLFLRFSGGGVVGVEDAGALAAEVHALVRRYAAWRRGQAQAGATRSRNAATAAASVERS